MADRFLVPGLDPAQRRKLARDAKSGKLRRLTSGLYTDNLTDPSAKVIERGALAVAAALYPGAILSGRSAATLTPSRIDHRLVLFLSDGKTRRVANVLGLEIRLDGGPGPIEGDLPFVGLFRPSEARQLLDNLAPSRATNGLARTLGRGAVEELVDKICAREGEAHLNVVRDQARMLAPRLGLEREFSLLDRIIGTVLGSRQERLVSAAARARASGQPYDPGCIARLIALRNHLDSVALPEVADTAVSPEAREAISFIEAYFSNYIEGTQFLIEEAKDIVFARKIPERRPQDGRDVLETFRQTAGLGPRAPSGLTYPEFREEIRSRHAGLMAARPEIRPGEFKDRFNAAGNTVFVSPDLVEGTLRAGVEMVSDLRAPFGRAAFLHFLLTDVHPFLDGNGRISRIMLTKELLVAGQSRIVIPTVHRDDYVDTLRLLSRDGRPDPLVRCLTFCQKVTAAASAPSVLQAIDVWASAYAFQEPSQQRLRLPDPTDPILWRDGVPGPKSHWDEQDARKQSMLPFA